MTTRSLRREALNLPNAITLTRIALIPVFLWFTYYESRVDSFIAAVVYALTGATDFLDGWVARRKNLVTVIGKFLDPLADKLIVMAALVMLVHLGRVAAWVVIVVMAREFIVTGLRTIAMSEGIVIAAGREGKHKTAFQVAAITFLLLHYTYPINAIFFSFDLDANRVGTWLLYISLVFSVWSAVSYFDGFIRAVYKAPQRSEAVPPASGGKPLDTPRAPPL
ncbi:CDP-diacylglycerol--glycerol-3-phosphate 3-phosphatidyltransferase [Anaeromyxobacter oryzisoli]|uniref:CDP-diacylglycerol--glycerol-3-phosphate 3-phosphatidyltransferase n=1 Tax=Anaeromyxobacter oryzisoli TaxID=2925408 RepID=UPI001F59A054|nr:CDP-diacylglycerol--glycerol-3-phosphate 3-phosphatidyltransferase [Anaeromyxobacter sp. SG63]